MQLARLLADIVDYQQSHNVDSAVSLGDVVEKLRADIVEDALSKQRRRRDREAQRGKQRRKDEGG